MNFICKFFVFAVLFCRLLTACKKAVLNSEQCKCTRYSGVNFEQVTPRGITCLGTALRGLGGCSGGATTTTTTTGGERRSLCSTTGSATSSAPTTPTASLAVLGIRERERQRERERERDREMEREAERADADEDGAESSGDKKDDGSSGGTVKEEKEAMQMSLNEYKAVEFVRKLVERVARSGTPGGVTVANIGG